LQIRFHHRGTESTEKCEIFSFAVERDGKGKALSRCAAGLCVVSWLPQASWFLSGRLSRPVKKANPL
jgi:hypothetical protein